VPLISKDAIKEALFDVVGVGDWAWSKTLSRAADAAMVEIAAALDAAVLDNYWHADTVEQLLAPIRGRVVEVFCRVDPSLARARLDARTRHPGHADGQAPVHADLASLAQRLPLGSLGPVVEVDTSAAVDVPALAAQMFDARRHLANPR
jgi:hypothetical protein